jgi:hypothetical protein
VLGLVAEPPAPQYVYQPSPREKSRLDGLVVAEQYNCSGCHTARGARQPLRVQNYASLGGLLAACVPKQQRSLQHAAAASNLERACHECNYLLSA